MGSLEELPTINNQMLTQVVQKMLKDESANVTDWKTSELQGGTLGKVYALSGTYSLNRIASNTESASVYNEHTTHSTTHKGSKLEKAGWSTILKIQKAYERFGDPDSWRREMLLYQSDLYYQLPKTLKAPVCYNMEDKQQGEIWLWLEHISGHHGIHLSGDHYALISRHLAHFQGTYLTGKPLPSYPWLSTQYWLVQTMSQWGTRAIPWIQTNKETGLSMEVVEGVQQLWAERDQLLDVFYSLPRTFCHRDFSAGNVFLTQDATGMDQTVVIDWDCAGIGIAGEDIADLVGEALIFYKFDPAKAVELQEKIVSHYILGLQEAGWNGDEKLIRLGYLISLTLHWCFRIICRAQKKDNPEINRYASVLSFIVHQAAEARKIISTLPMK
ncbi:Phosphotransferase enzyme family protein [Paenibacillus sp. 1_12]|uniref:aminoglycoside phosphotransferase family protein n=1 Tax=Paenibacillus sp. 1_12 TaxID=1566278 RepID=UPI0008F226AA|nr:aminoglycoside phosphotransferase family protein [Paenibacillus sp. 1_12]SFL74810.1 Phosphotransferase enzyme family protein [Paenibacillus sp. 1_12]